MISQDNVKITTADEYEKNAVKQFGEVLRFLKNHPTLSITLFYLIISILGLFYIYQLSNYFSIDILPHLEISDFILAPIHYPISMIIAILLIFFTWFFYKVERLLRRNKRIAASYDRFYKPLFFFKPIFTYSFTLILLLMAAMKYAAEFTHHEITENKSQHYSISLSEHALISDKSVTHLSQVQIIADTVKYLWVYDHENKDIHAIPQKNVAGLLPTIK